MDVDHELILCAFRDGVVQPAGPLLTTDLNEAELDPGNAPIAIERQELIELLFEGAAVDVEDDTDVALLGVFDDGVKVERTGTALRVERDGGGV